RLRLNIHIMQPTYIVFVIKKVQITFFRNTHYWLSSPIQPLVLLVCVCMCIRLTYVCILKGCSLSLLCLRVDVTPLGWQVNKWNGVTEQAESLENITTHSLVCLYTIYFSVT